MGCTGTPMLDIHAAQWSPLWVLQLVSCLCNNGDKQAIPYLSCLELHHQVSLSKASIRMIKEDGLCTMVNERQASYGELHMGRRRRE